MPPSHRTRFHYVLENVAKRAQTVCERSGRSYNLLRSVYELHGRARKGAPERRACSKFSGGHPVLQLDGVTAFLKRDGRTTNRIAVLQSYYGHVTTWCGAVGHQLAVRVQTDQSVCSSFIAFADRPNSTDYVLSASLFSPNTFKTKVQALNELATRLYTVLKVRSRFSVFGVSFCRSHAVLTKSTPSAVWSYKLWYKYGLFPHWFIILSRDFWLCKSVPDQDFQRFVPRTMDNFAALMLNVGFMQ